MKLERQLKEEVYDDYKKKPQAQEEEIDRSLNITEEQIKEVITQSKQPISDVNLKCDDLILTILNGGLR